VVAGQGAAASGIQGREYRTGRDRADRNGYQRQDAGPHKFLGTDLESILKAKHIETLITVGTSAEAAVLSTASAAAFRRFKVIVPVDGVSSGTTDGEQSTAWYLAHAPRVSQQATLTAVDRVKF
jgi:nicotinamidase-related amidase